MTSLQNGGIGPPDRAPARLSEPPLDRPQKRERHRRSVRSRISIVSTAAVLSVAPGWRCASEADGAAPHLLPPVAATAPVPLLEKGVIFSPGVISDDRWQYRITFTRDGETAYYTVAEGFFPTLRKATIYRSSLQPDGVWSTPAVASFSGEYTDIDPFITADGQRLYFSSIRPLGGAPKPDLDIFYVERRASGEWGAPVRLGPEVNTDRDELYASLDAAGTLYVASGPPAPTPEEDWNIYWATPTAGGFEPREPLAAVNTRLEWNPADPTRDWEFNPEISPDGNTLIFASLRPGGYGYGDLYVSRRTDGKWSAPTNLGPGINTMHDEFHPTISRDGRTLFFARTLFSAAARQSDLYTAALPFTLP